MTKKGPPKPNTMKFLGQSTDLNRYLIDLNEYLNDSNDLYEYLIDLNASRKRKVAGGNEKVPRGNEVAVVDRF